MSLATRSRAVSLPSRCCLSIFLAPPPCRSRSSSNWISSTSCRIGPALVVGTDFRIQKVASLSRTASNSIHFGKFRRCYDEASMAARTQITLDTEIQRLARKRASDLGCSLAEYVRRLVARDLGLPQAKPDVS